MKNEQRTVEDSVSGDGTGLMEGWVGSEAVRGRNPKREHSSFIQEQVAMLV